MPQVRVHNFSVSLDGFGTGEGQSLDAPFGHAGVAGQVAAGRLTTDAAATVLLKSTLRLCGAAAPDRTQR